MKLQPAKIAQQARAAIGHLSTIESLTPMLGRVNDWIDDARRGTDFEAIKRGGTEGSDPEMRATRDRPDPITGEAERFCNALKESARWAQVARRIAESWTLTVSESEHPHRGAGEGECKVCTKYVPGLPNDRLRSGRCNPCRVYFERHQTERPRDLWAEDEEAA